MKSLLGRSIPTAFVSGITGDDFGWDDGLMCGGKVCGVILPNAQRAGEEFWGELAERPKTVAWGVKGDYSIVA